MFTFNKEEEEKGTGGGIRQLRGNFFLFPPTQRGEVVSAKKTSYYLNVLFLFSNVGECRSPSVPSSGSVFPNCFLQLPFSLLAGGAPMGK